MEFRSNKQESNNNSRWKILYILQLIWSSSAIISCNWNVDKTKIMGKTKQIQFLPILRTGKLRLIEIFSLFVLYFICSVHFYCVRTVISSLATVFSFVLHTPQMCEFMNKIILNNKIFTLKFFGHLRTNSLSIPQHQQQQQKRELELCKVWIVPVAKKNNVPRGWGRCDSSGVVQCTELRKPSLSFNWFRFDFGAVEYWFNRSVYTIFFSAFDNSTPIACDRNGGDFFSLVHISAVLGENCGEWRSDRKKWHVSAVIREHMRRNWSNQLQKKKANYVCGERRIEIHNKQTNNERTIKKIQQTYTHTYYTIRQL